MYPCRTRYASRYRLQLLRTAWATGSHMVRDPLVIHVFKIGMPRHIIHGGKLNCKPSLVEVYEHRRNSRTRMMFTNYDPHLVGPIRLFIALDLPHLSYVATQPPWRGACFRKRLHSEPMPHRCRRSSQSTANPQPCAHPDFSRWSPRS